MPIATVRLTDEQAAWITAQTTQYRKKADVIRDLIDTARQACSGGVDYAPTVSVRETGTQTHPVDQPEMAVQPVQEKISPPLSDPFLGDGVGKGESEGKTPRKPLSFSRDIPDALDPFAPLIEEFWRVKKGSKSSNAWSLLITELEKINASFGKDRTTEQLELAINGLWKGITMRNLQRFESPKGYSAAQEQPSNHPASRVFTAADFDMPNPDNPLKELF